MKKEVFSIRFILMLVFCGLLPWTSAQAQHEQDHWKRVPLGSDRIYVPTGFDDNDRIRVGVDAWLQNTCQKPAETFIEIDAESQVINVVPSALEPVDDNGEGFVCATLAKRVPLVIDLGYLPHGDYEVVTSNGWLVERLHVAEAESAGPDLFSYAKVNAADISFNGEEGVWQLMLAGELNSSCESINFIETKTDGYVVEVLPVIERRDDIICTPKVEQFKMIKDLDQPLEHGERYMLHVRSSNGNDVSKILQMKP